MARLSGTQQSRCRGSIAACVALVGCSSAPPPAGFPKDPIMTVTSQNAAYQVEVRTSPQPPTRGDQSVELTITDVATGAPATKLAITVVPWMPVMLHGASIQPSVTETKPGVYLLTDVDMFMAGEWQLRTTIESTGASTDHVGPIFQIP